MVDGKQTRRNKEGRSGLPSVTVETKRQLCLYRDDPPPYTLREYMGSLDRYAESNTKLDNLNRS